MENTTRDFLKMIVDYKVSVVVMCCDLQERGKVLLNISYVLTCIIVIYLYVLLVIDSFRKHVSCTGIHKINCVLENLKLR